MVTTDDKILEMLTHYKWGKDYRCVKCGNRSYKKGKTPFSRRCTNKKCDYDESVTKFTAFEGVRFSLFKAYSMAVEVMDSSEVDWQSRTISLEPEKKIKKEERTVLDNYNLGEAISIDNLLLRYQKDELSSTQTDRLLVEEFAARELTIARLAKKYELTENTVAKFFNKIESRIPLENDCFKEGAIKRLQDFISGRSMDYLLGFLMLPLREEGWKYGELKKNDKWYSMSDPGFVYEGTLAGLRWQVSEVTFVRFNEIGELESFYNKEDEPEYRVPKSEQ